MEDSGGYRCELALAGDRPWLEHLVVVTKLEESFKGTLLLEVDETEISRQLTKMCKKWQNLWMTASRQYLAILRIFLSKLKLWENIFERINMCEWENFIRWLFLGWKIIRGCGISKILDCFDYYIFWWEIHIGRKNTRGNMIR